MNKSEIIEHALTFKWGGMTEAELNRLYDLSVEKTILELGCMVGMSSYVMASCCQSLHCVDIWDDEYKHLEHDKLQQNAYLSFKELSESKDVFTHNCNDFIDKITMYQGMTEDIKFSFMPHYFDMILIDADHSYEGVKTDLYNYFSKLKLDGILVLHDYGCPTWPGVKKACDDFQSESGVRLELKGLVERLANFTILKST